MASSSAPAQGLDPRPGQPRRDGLCGRILGGRFRVEARIAEGGMARVYRAVQIPLGRLVALKVLRAPAPPDRLASFHRRFLLEASIQARLRHPNHVTIYDFGRHPPNIFFLAMEYLAGVSLRLALLRARAFVAPRAVHIAIGIARALREAHALGALHRDLKPANVFLERRADDPDFVKVLDFGLVKRISGETEADADITHPGRTLGSPGYMAPEQIQGLPGGPPCDVYAVGVMLYEMLAGQPPFVRTGVAETMMAHVHEPPPPLCQSHPRRQIPRGLGAVVHACLAKDAAARPPSMEALLTALAPWSGWDDTVAEATAPPGAAGDWELGPRDEWSVVSTTGILARPPTTAAAGERAVPATGDQATQVWRPPRRRPAAPAVAPPPSPGRGRRRPRLLAAAALAGVGAGVLAAVWAARWAPPRRLELATRPAGAVAFVNGLEVCPATPCRLAWPPATSPSAAAAPMAADRLHVRFVLAGHHEHITGRPARGLRLEVRADMRPVDRGGEKTSSGG